jgi:hypothetical protein
MILLTGVEDLKCRINEDESLNTSVKIVARSAIASLFFFELDEVSSYGYIRCLIKLDDPAFQPLISKLISKSASFYVDQPPLQGVFTEGSFTVTRFRKKTKVTYGCLEIFPFY